MPDEVLSAPPVTVGTVEAALPSSGDGSFASPASPAEPFAEEESDFLAVCAVSEPEAGPLLCGEGDAVG